MKPRGLGSADQEGGRRGRAGVEAAGGCPSWHPRCRSLADPTYPKLRTCQAWPPSISCVTEEGTWPQRGPGRVTCCGRQQTETQTPLSGAGPRLGKGPQREHVQVEQGGTPRSLLSPRLCWVNKLGFLSLKLSILPWAGWPVPPLPPTSLRSHRLRARDDPPSTKEPQEMWAMAKPS